MKFYLIFISLLFFNNSIYTQVNKYLISTDKTRVIYRGIDNPISISCDGCLDKLKVSIEGESSTIKKINDGQYLINTKEYLNNLISNDKEEFTNMVNSTNENKLPIFLINTQMGE